MDAMTHEQNYRFDVAGYMIVPGVLTAAELAACNGALDQLDARAGRLRWQGPVSNPLLALRQHPVLLWYAQQLCGEQARLDTPLQLVAERTAAEPLQNGGEWVDWSRAYRQYNGERFCQGIRAYWALVDINEADGGPVAIQGSHNSTVEAPQDLVAGCDEMGLVEQVELRAGDLLLCAESLTRGFRPWRGEGPQRLVECGFIGGDVRPSAESMVPESGEAMPGWADELDPFQRAILHNPDRSYPPPVVHSDGAKTWFAEEPGVHHPSIFIRDPDSAIDEKEFYHWDLCGHLVIKGVMDEEWLKVANAAIDENPDRISHGGSAAGDSTPLAGSGVGRSSLGNPWTLPDPHGEPFRRMIADPALVQRLNWIMGSGYECMQCSGFLSGKGSSGHFLHSPATPARVTNHYRQQNGRVYAEYLNVAWQLRDVKPEYGGFVCVPGSHKTAYAMPDGIRTCENEMGLVKHVAMEAGDVLLFLASAQAHGAYPWMGEENRRMIFFQYRSRGLYRS